MTEFAAPADVAVTPVGAFGADVALGAPMLMLWVTTLAPAVAATVHVPVETATTRPVSLSTEQTSGVVVA